MGFPTHPLCLISPAGLSCSPLPYGVTTLAYSLLVTVVPSSCCFGSFLWLLLPVPSPRAGSALKLDINIPLSLLVLPQAKSSHLLCVLTPESTVRLSLLVRGVCVFVCCPFHVVTGNSRGPFITYIQGVIHFVAQ